MLRAQIHQERSQHDIEEELLKYTNESKHFEEHGQMQGEVYLNYRRLYWFDLVDEIYFNKLYLPKLLKSTTKLCVCALPLLSKLINIDILKVYI